MKYRENKISCKKKPFSSQKKKKKIEGCQRVKLLNICVKIKVMQCLESFTTKIRINFRLSK